MKRVVFLCGLLSVVVLAWMVSRRLDATGVIPSQLPAPLHSVRPVPARHIQVFLRHRCRFCALHLQEMETAMATLPDSLGRLYRDRIRLWEFDATASSCTTGVRPSPVPAHRLGITSTPTTWFVSERDSIEQIWVGVRSASAWRRALLALDDRRTP